MRYFNSPLQGYHQAQSDVLALEKLLYIFEKEGNQKLSQIIDETADQRDSIPNLDDENKRIQSFTADGLKHLFDVKSTKCTNTSTSSRFPQVFSVETITKKTHKARKTHKVRKITKKTYKKTKTGVYKSTN